MLTLIISIIVFGLLIGVHEAGHLVAAKLNHVKVHEFAIGMGPKLFSFGKGETEYSLRLIPIGGYCQMEGENEQSEDSRAFCNKKPLARIVILAAGAVMNLVLGYVAFVIFFAPVPQFAVPEVANVIAEAPAASQGLMAGDRIVKLNHTKINIQNDITFFMSRNGDKPIDVTVERNGERLTIPITPYQQDGEWLIGFQSKVVNNSFWETIKMAFYGEIFIMKLVLVTFGDLITGAVSLSATSGPVGIVTEIGKAAKMGFSNVVYIVALITVNLGLFNLLPIPALDGGRIVFVLIELIFRKRVPANVEGTIHAVGLMLLLLLMVFVTFQDIGRIEFVKNLFG